MGASHDPHTLVNSTSRISRPQQEQHTCSPTFKLSLLSIGQLTDCGMTEVYTADYVHINRGQELMLSGTCRGRHTGLWHIELPTSAATTKEVIHASACISTQAVTNATIQNKSHAERVAFYHKCFAAPTGSPVAEFNSRASRPT